MRGSLRNSILSFVVFAAFLPALVAQDPQKSASPAVRVGSARGAVARFVLEHSLTVPVQPIRGLAFGGGRPNLAALGDDEKVRVWNATTGNLLQTIALPDHPKSATCMAFSPDGKWIAVGEGISKAEIFAGRIELVDAGEGHAVRALATHHWEVESLAFSVDGRWLVSSNWDSKVRVIEFPSGKQVREFESASKPGCAAISPDSRLVASGDSDASVTVWNRTTGKAIQPLLGHNRAISAVTFSPDGQQLASASADGSTRIWSVATGRDLLTLSGHVGPVNSVAYSPDGRFVFTGGDDGTVRFWDAATGQNFETLGAHSSVWQVALSSDGRYLAAGYADGTINVWRAQ
jgi:dipeptidyl aminopeptidase/acylaminoacyl peptidase